MEISHIRSINNTTKVKLCPCVVSELHCSVVSCYLDSLSSITAVTTYSLKFSSYWYVSVRIDRLHVSCSICWCWSWIQTRNRRSWSWTNRNVTILIKEIHIVEINQTGLISRILECKVVDCSQTYCLEVSYLQSYACPFTWSKSLLTRVSFFLCFYIIHTRLNRCCYIALWYIYIEMNLFKTCEVNSCCSRDITKCEMCPTETLYLKNLVCSTLDCFL